MLVACYPAGEVDMSDLFVFLVGRICYHGTLRGIYCPWCSNLPYDVSKAQESRNGFGVQKLARVGNDCGNLLKPGLCGTGACRDASFSSYANHTGRTRVAILSYSSHSASCLSTVALSR